MVRCVVVPSVGGDKGDGLLVWVYGALGGCLGQGLHEPIKGLMKVVLWGWLWLRDAQNSQSC